MDDTILEFLDILTFGCILVALTAVSAFLAIIVSDLLDSLIRRPTHSQDDK